MVADSTGTVVRLLGTGDAYNTDGRGCQAVLIEPEDRSPFLVDAGPTVMQAMESGRIDSSRLDRLFVTHLHGDHVAGWPFLALRMATREGRVAPFVVHGPTGTRECLEGLAALCYGNLLRDPGFEIRYREFPVRESSGLRDEGAPAFDVIPVEHHPTSVGYRFLLNGKCVAVSGDTAWCDALPRLASGSALLILECSQTDRGDLPHVSLEELRRGHASLGAARIVLTHLTDEVAESLAADPIPGVAAGHDGMALTV